MDLIAVMFVEVLVVEIAKAVVVIIAQCNVNRIALIIACLVVVMNAVDVLIYATLV